MNKQLIQNILYAGHCIGICSDWSKQTVNTIIDTMKDEDYVYNKTIIDADKFEELMKENISKYVSDCVSSFGPDRVLTMVDGYVDGFKIGYKKALNYE